MSNKIKVCVHLADIHIRTFRFHDEYKDVFNSLISDLNELLKKYFQIFNNLLRNYDIVYGQFKRRFSIIVLS